MRGGAPAVTDGPFAEAKEYLGGYLDRRLRQPRAGTEIAARWPERRLGAIEVRPIMDDGRREM